MPSPVLSTLALFADLTEAEIESISRATRGRRYGKRSLIHASGAMGADFYVIESGRVTIQLPSDRGQELTLRLLWPGDFSGELSLLDAGALATRHGVISGQRFRRAGTCVQWTAVSQCTHRAGQWSQPAAATSGRGRT